MCKYAFVILHYNTIEDTKECIASIERNVQEASHHIIIVDNNSPNETGKKLVELYGNKKNIVVIQNKENLGFAKGNNVGFKYAKHELGADFIILMNNDTELIDNTFVSVIEAEYENSGFALLGPLEILPDPPFHGRHEGRELITKLECIKSVVLLSLYYVLSYFGIDIYLRKQYGRKKKETIQSLSEEPQIREEGVQLHGFFWVFSPQYIRLFDGINSKTFLYREEELLFLRLKEHHLKSVYLPSLRIKHRCSRATNSLFKKKSHFRRFFYYHTIRSTVILLKELFTFDNK